MLPGACDKGFAEACPELFFALKVKNIFTMVKM